MRTRSGGYTAGVRLLRADRRPTAIFAVNDVACVGALSAAAELGLSVPRDVSLVGYDNTYLSRLRHLWLTTVDIASREVGRRAGELLMQRIDDPTRPSVEYLAAPTLIVRGSTAPPAPNSEI
jgi:DNA-binding LacI/PurR family transcriptional regulator